VLRDIALLQCSLLKSTDIYMRSNSFVIALTDIAGSVKRWPLVGMLGWQDLRQRYRRSALGPFWITLSMGVTIGTIGTVFGQIFSSPIADFLPFLTIGMVLWSFISAVVTEGSTGFIGAEAIIKQLPIPLFVHILRLVWRNILMLAHNFVIFPIVMLVLGKPLSWLALLSIPGLLLLTLNLTWVALILGILCARYRDIPQIVASALQVLFYLTPIMWLPKLLPARAGVYLLDANPLFHLMEIVRAPLLGEMPTAGNWTVSMCLAIGGWLAALLIYGRYKRVIAYWL
jgi:lipopolysaccharide transport system permease protein